MTTDLESDAQVGDQDIMTSTRKKVRGKKITGNVIVALLDNVSFHSKCSAHMWKYVAQIRVACER